MLNQLGAEAHKNAVDKGFYESPKNIGEMIALMHSELSEALEADRKGKYCLESIEWINRLEENDFKSAYENNVKGTMDEEMADIIIRVLDFCAFKGIDLDSHVDAKMRYNSLREKYHGKKY